MTRDEEKLLARQRVRILPVVLREVEAILMVERVRWWQRSRIGRIGCWTVVVVQRFPAILAGATAKTGDDGQETEDGNAEDDILQRRRPWARSCLEDARSVSATRRQRQ